MSHPDASLPVPLSALVEEAKDTLARNVVAARSALAKTQEELAAGSGYSRATINQIESAQGDPRLSTLVAIAGALGLSPVFLLLGREEIESMASAQARAQGRDVQAQLSPEDVDTMNRLLQSGVAKNRSKAIGMGTSAAAMAGVIAGPALAAAGIGTVLLPGIGTAVLAALAFGASLVTRKSR